MSFGVGNKYIMPIPERLPTESKSDFISRFLGNAESKKEYPNDDERLAVAMSKADKKPKTQNTQDNDCRVRHVEIFKPGIWNGNEYTVADLKEMIKNFKDGILKPVLNIDHNERLTEKLQNSFAESSGYKLEGINQPGLGIAEDIYLIGEKLFADFIKVPKIIADLVDEGALSSRSSEIYSHDKQFTKEDGSLVNNVLSGVTFFGFSAPPAVKGMSNELYVYQINELNENQTEESEMTEKEIAAMQLENSNLKKEKIELKSKLDAATTVLTDEEKKKAKKFQDDYNAYKEENEKIKKENVELNKFKTEYEAAAVQAKENELNAYMKVLTESGKLKPAEVEVEKKLYQAAEGAGEEVFNSYKKRWEVEKTKNVFKKLTPDGTAKPPEGETKDYKGVKTYQIENDDDMANAIDTVMEEKKMEYGAAHNYILDNIEEAK